MDSTKIKINDAKVIFANLVDEGFGRSITIEVTPEMQNAIEAWVKNNNIGKDNPGVANFKEYQPKDEEGNPVGDAVTQFAFKINDKTEFVGANGLSKDDLGYGAHISLIAKAFDYDNKFGKGTSQSLSAVYIIKSKSTGNEDDINELLADAGEEKPEQESQENVTDIPF